MRKNFKTLRIWQRSRALVKEIYTLSENFPSDERYGLAKQIKRSSISIPSNISEGCGRRTDKELNHFLDIAIGSLCELETQLYLSLDLDFVQESRTFKLVDEIIQIRKMVISYQKSLKL